MLHGQNPDDVQQVGAMDLLGLGRDQWYGYVGGSIRLWCRLQPYYLIYSLTHFEQ